MRMHEEVMREFGVDPKQVTSLELVNQTGDVAKLEPACMSQHDPARSNARQLAQSPRLDLVQPGRSEVVGLELREPVDAGPRVLQHYIVRNQIVHGKLRPQRIDGSIVIDEFYLIQASLARN